MTLLLAPMEGLLDATLRDVLTRTGGVDRCVSEFIRITNTLLPERAFTRVVPELLNGGRTLAGVPVRPQLLGSDPACLADNAARLAGLSPFGVDLNFGCPAKTVNASRGGAVLLDEPELIGRIVAAVRRAGARRASLRPWAGRACRGSPLRRCGCRRPRRRESRRHTRRLRRPGTGPWCSGFAGRLHG